MNNTIKILIIIALQLVSLVFLNIIYANASSKSVIDIGKNYKIYFMRYSPDWKSFAYIKCINFHECILIKDGKKIDEGNILYFKYSPDSKSFAYINQKASDRYVLIKDGKKIDESFDISNFKYSPDSKSFAYLKLLLDSNFNTINLNNINYSYVLIKDGKKINEGIKIGYVEEGGRKKKYDGKFPETAIEDFWYSPDSKSFAYIRCSLVSTHFKSKCIFIKDGEKIDEGPGRYIKLFNLKYSPDWKSFAYLKYVPDPELNNSYSNYVLIKDGKKISKNYVHFFWYSPNSKSFAYIDSWYSSNREILIKDGKKIDDDILVFKYSPDSKSFAYIKRNDHYTLIKDGKKIDEGFDIKSFKYSPDSKSFAYINKITLYRDVLIRDGKKIDEGNEIPDLKYSPDSKSFAYIKYTDNSKSYILIKDGKKIDEDFKNEFESYNVNLQDFKYSPDSKSFAYIKYTDNSKKYVLIKDGKEIDKGYPSMYENRLGMFRNFVYSQDWKSFAYSNWHYLIIQSNINNIDNKINTKVYKKVDIILENFFIKMRKQDSTASAIVYRLFISKINFLINKTKDIKKKQLLEYIKDNIKTEVIKQGLLKNIKDLFKTVNIRK